MLNHIRLPDHPSEYAESPAVTPTSVSDFAIHQLGFYPDPLQAAVLDSQADRGLLLCSRQWGKSTLTAIKAIYRALTVPGSLILVSAPSERQSAEWIRKAAVFVRSLGIRPRGDGANAHSILFPNGSRIVGLPGAEATIRGFSSVSLLLIDEAARVPDDLYRALRPMLAVGADSSLWLMSTPFGKRGFFYDEWSDGVGWERFTGRATECPRIRPAFLDEERRVLGDSWFAQEYLCEFADNGMSLFPIDLVKSVIDHDLKPLF